ncbi:PTS sugar transporter subunit IIA [Furfurilactobacillus sp. WILCCON 0119]
MIAIIVASHGTFSEGITQSSAMIFGNQEKVVAVGVTQDDDPDQLRKRYDQILATFAADDEVLFLVDVWGGPAFNVASQLVAEHSVRMGLLTGVNLPMLVEAYTVRRQPLADVIAHLEVIAKAGIKHLEV